MALTQSVVWRFVPDEFPTGTTILSVHHEGARLGALRAGVLMGTSVRANRMGDVWVQEQARLAKTTGYAPTKE
eukprot:6789039-Lingulodinium_polyedra.AAC.1